MGNTADNKKRIVKNTVFLYIRMLFLSIIAFFTSRILLDKLGVVDYGINNVVGGLASMFVFFRSALSNATQRYLNIALGRGNEEEAHQVFCQHLSLYICIAIFVVLCAEVIGIWFINHKLIIPADRLDAAFWVFQFTVVSMGVTILNVTYNAVLVAHENMKIYSYIGVFEGCSRLFVAYMISIVEFDKLITLGFLTLFISLCSTSFYLAYCIKYYPESHYNFYWDKSNIKETFSFISWNVLGTAVYAVNAQGINMLLNIFFGPVVNAARGISFQVDHALLHFVGNFTTAVQPQIVKSYAAKDYNYLFKLVYGSAKYSVYILWFLSLPLMLCMETILNLWLKDVPPYTCTFTIWVLAYSLANSLNNPIWILAIAIGKLKWYSIIGNGVFLLTFPISYVALRNGMSPVSVFVVAFVIRCIYIVVVLFVLKIYISITIYDWVVKVVVPVASVISISGSLCYLAHRFMDSSIGSTIYTFIMTTVAISIAVWSVGLNRLEKKLIRSFVTSKIGR